MTYKIEENGLATSRLAFGVPQTFPIIRTDLSVQKETMESLAIDQDEMNPIVAKKNMFSCINKIHFKTCRTQP